MVSSARSTHNYKQYSVSFNVAKVQENQEVCSHEEDDLSQGCSNVSVLCCHKSNLLITELLSRPVKRIKKRMNRNKKRQRTTKSDECKLLTERCNSYLQFKYALIFNSHYFQPVEPIVLIFNSRIILHVNRLALTIYHTFSSYSHHHTYHILLVHPKPIPSPPPTVHKFPLLCSSNTTTSSDLPITSQWTLTS